MSHPLKIETFAKHIKEINPPNPLFKGGIGYPLHQRDLCITRSCEEHRDEAIQSPWIYPCAARKLRNIITAVPLCGSRRRIGWVKGKLHKDFPLIQSSLRGKGSRFPIFKGGQGDFDFYFLAKSALATLILTVGWFFIFPTTIFAQGKIQLTYQVDAQVSVFGNDFVKARELAVSLAFKSALEKALRNFLGDEKFKANQKNFSKTLNHADRYVQSYRFIEAVDDPIGKVSEVVMQVTLFPNALGKSLRNTGMAVGSLSSKKVIIIISEKSLTSGEAVSFWETVPISEAALVQNFSENGVDVVSRDLIKDTMSEEYVLDAVKGDVNSAVQIGLNVGADIVILGNAVSSRLENQIESAESTIQTTISVRVISALTSTVIAAKSDFASARNEDLLAGELEAFGDASRKLSEFLLNSLNRYWKAPSASQRVEDSRPQAPSTVAPPSSMEDL